MLAFIKSLIKKFVNAYRRLSIQTVISLSFTVVAVVCMSFVGIILSVRFATTTNSLIYENKQRELSQTNMSLDNYLKQMMRISDTLYYKNIKNTDLGRESILDSLYMLYDANPDNIVSIALFDMSGEILASAPFTKIKQNASPTEESWFAAAVESEENLHFSTPHVQNIFDDVENKFRWVISLSRQVEITINGIPTSGILLVDMSFSGLERICVDMNPSENSYIYLIDEKGSIIYHPKQQLIYSGLQNENNIVAATYADGINEEVFESAKRSVIVKTVGYTGWKLVSVVFDESFETASTNIITFGLFLLLFTFFLTLFLNLRISAYISIPIQKLEHAVNEFEKGVKDIDFSQEGGFEVQSLSRSIESMVSTMQHLMDDIVVQERQKRRLELEVLQSQINPHFLYNTLDSIIWMTENGQYEDAINMVTSLARLFRIALSKGKTIIPISEELEHAKHYMAIQEMRYKNRFTTIIEKDDDVSSLYCLKLSVQPILENAIYHGVGTGIDDGKIFVSARREGEDVIISVSDTGYGMTESQVSALLDDTKERKSSKGSGIGLINVHKRLQMTFGEEYGLSIISEPDKGTTVNIKIPVITNENFLKEEKEAGQGEK